MNCEKCGGPRHNVRDEDEPLCWTCRRAAREQEEGYKPRAGRKKYDPNMARTGTSNVWTKMTPEAVAWLKTVGVIRREAEVPWSDIKDEMIRRFGVDVTLSNLMNIMAGRAWGWMDNPEEHANEYTRRQLGQLRRYAGKTG